MDALIDPVTRDYRLTVGRIERDPSGGLLNACFLRLSTPLGSYWRDRAFGSRLHELAREKDVARIELLARQYASQALKPVLDDGRATAVHVESQRQNGRLYLLVSVTAASGETLIYKHLVKVI
ncbi:MAG: hypothetical protein JWL63_3197 [Rhodocyclales bacterium]|nr:hypothetical protein [Rhodocyclales bacterium]